MILVYVILGSAKNGRYNVILQVAMNTDASTLYVIQSALKYIISVLCFIYTQKVKIKLKMNIIFIFCILVNSVVVSALICKQRESSSTG